MSCPGDGLDLARRSEDERLAAEAWISLPRVMSMARRPPRRLPLSITFLLARAGAEIIGPHLLDGTNTPTLHRDIAQNQVSIEDLLAPFAGKKTGLAFRVHHDNDAKTDGSLADAIVASLRETGLPADPAEAVAVLAKSPVPLSITLQYEYLDDLAWPDGVKDLAICTVHGVYLVLTKPDGGLNEYHPPVLLSDESANVQDVVALEYDEDTAMDIVVITDSDTPNRVYFGDPTDPTLANVGVDDNGGLRHETLEDPSGAPGSFEDSVRVLALDTDGDDGDDSFVIANKDKKDQVYFQGDLSNPWEVGDASTTNDVAAFTHSDLVNGGYYATPHTKLKIVFAKDDADQWVTVDRDSYGSELHRGLKTLQQSENCYLLCRSHPTTVAHRSTKSVGDLAARPQGGVGDVLRALGGGVVFSGPVLAAQPATQG